MPFFKARRPLPPVVPTDEVVPVHLFDDTPALRRATMVWTYRFSEVLDPDKLSDSLCQLFHMEGWRKLGGRYRCRPDGKLEIHIPIHFTKERPPLNFSKETHHMRMSEHPIASKLPLATGKVAIYPSPRAFHSLVLGSGAPRNFEDFIYSDLPQFSLHVTTFDDGTIVGVSHPHMTAGLSGFTAVVNAWSLILAGKSEAVPPFVGFREDGMKGLLVPPTDEKHILSGKELTGWRLAYWSLRSLYESRRSPLEYRILCIPKSTLRKVIDESRESIAFKKSSSTTGTDEKPYITEGDVLAAIASRSMAQNQQPGSTRNIVTMMALDPFFRANSAFSQNSAYVQNIPTAIFFSCSANKAVETSLGELALLARDAITTQGTEGQIKAYMSLSAASIEKTGRKTFFGDKDMVLQAMSNWLKAYLFDKVDFSPAIVKEAPESDIDEPSMVPLWTVMGADFHGNIWLSCILSRHTWAKLFDFLESFEYSPKAKL